MTDQQINQIKSHLQTFIIAETWTEKKAYLEQHPSLLTDEAMQVLQALIEQAHQDEQIDNLLIQHYKLLIDCQQKGIEVVFAMDTIQQLVREINGKFQPQKIILFGSYAYGKPTVDSDVDLLLLMETEQKPIHMAAQVAAAIPHPLPLDILVWTPTHFADSVARQAVFATEIMNKGVVLYESGNPRVGQ
ncbi:nucleotidyltransferase domain-containing protein [Anaerolineales bacterium HSG24]|nr:nucleotidyltransferase domain-containing protein [Anaerolineales bacterium HSG24]